MPLVYRSMVYSPNRRIHSKKLLFATVPMKRVNQRSVYNPLQHMSLWNDLIIISQAQIQEFQLGEWMLKTRPGSNYIDPYLDDFLFTGGIYNEENSDILWFVMRGRFMFFNL